MTRAYSPSSLMHELAVQRLVNQGGIIDLIYCLEFLFCSLVTWQLLVDLSPTSLVLVANA